MKNSDKDKQANQVNVIHLASFKSQRRADSEKSDASISAERLIMPEVLDLSSGDITSNRERATITKKCSEGRSLCVQDLVLTAWTSDYIETFTRRYLVEVTIGSDKHPYNVSRFEELPVWLLSEVRQTFLDYQMSARSKLDGVAAGWEQGHETPVNKLETVPLPKAEPIKDVSLFSFRVKVYPRRLTFPFFFLLVGLFSAIVAALYGSQAILVASGAELSFAVLLALVVLASGDGIRAQNHFGTESIRVTSFFGVKQLRYGTFLNGETYHYDWLPVRVGS